MLNLWENNRIDVKNAFSMRLYFIGVINMPFLLGLYLYIKHYLDFIELFSVSVMTYLKANIDCYYLKYVYFETRQTTHTE